MMAMNEMFVCDTLKERFDEEMLNEIIKGNVENSIDPDTIKQLKRFVKMKSGVGVNYCEYELVENSYNLGRIYVKKFISVGTFERDVRNALIKNYYWDLDQVNSNPTLMLYDMKKRGLVCENLEKLCNDRENILTSLTPNRDLSKQIILIIMFGGCNSLSDELGYKDDKNIDDNEYVNNNEFLFKLKNEIQKYQQVIFNEYSHLHDKKLGNKGKLKQRNNPKATITAFHIHTLERNVLMLMNEFIKINKRKVGIFLHDGLYVEKLENEKTPPDYLVDELEKYVFEKTGITMKFKFKPIETTITIKPKKISNEIKPEYENEEYQEYKKEFEKTYFYCIEDKCFYRWRNGTLKNINEKEINTDIFKKMIKWKYDDDNGKIQRVFFLDKWTTDIKQLRYERVAFEPKMPDELRISNSFNSFGGFEVEKRIEDLGIDENEMLDNVDELYETTLIKDYIENLICNKNPEMIEYIYNWMTHLIFRPYKPTKILLNMYSEKEGTGKDTFGLLIEALLGDKYVVGYEGLEPLYNHFNADLIDKLFVVCSETSSKDLKDNEKANSKRDKLKNILTRKTLNITKKGQDTFKARNLLNFMGTTNNRITLNNDDGQRRFYFLEIPDTRKGDKEYWDKFYEEEIETDVLDYTKKKSYSIIYLYFYLKKHYIHNLNKFNFEKIPENEYSKEVKRETIKPEIKFFEILFNEYNDKFESIIDCLTLNKDIDEFKFSDLRTIEILIKNKQNKVKGLVRNDLYEIYEKILKEDMKFNLTNNKEKFYNCIDKNFVENNEKFIKENGNIKTGLITYTKSNYLFYRINDLNLFLTYLSNKYHLKFNRLQEETKPTFNFNL